MAAYTAAQEPTWAPGERFEYNTGTTTLLARMVGDAIDADPAGVRAYLDVELFDKLGMDPVRTQFDAAGTWLGGFSADTTAQNYAKLGLPYLRGGRWDGEQILPEDWIEYSRAPSPANPEYGAHWWLDPERPGVMYAVGARGQTITVDPAHGPGDRAVGHGRWPTHLGSHRIDPPGLRCPGSDLLTDPGRVVG
jgi:CubicO group peptidase (beta-lactamase class C family)